MRNHSAKKKPQGYALALILSILSIISLFIIGLQQELQFAQRIQTQEAIQMTEEQEMLQSMGTLVIRLAKDKSLANLEVHKQQKGSFASVYYILTRLPNTPCVMSPQETVLRWYQMRLESANNALQLESTLAFADQTPSETCKQQRIIHSPLVALAFI